MYGSELWFKHPAPDIEIVQNTFCKVCFKSPVQASNCFVYKSPYKLVRKGSSIGHVTYLIKVKEV